MEVKSRKFERKPCPACHCHVKKVNGVTPDESRSFDGDIENISKGGFRFITSNRFELEDRITVDLVFTDGSSQETLGRICYCNELEDNEFAYGFSILEGFYHLK